MLMSAGVDTEPLFASIVKFVASNDVVCKKLAYWYVRHFDDKQDLVLLAVNGLVKDCSDPSPMTRGLALKTLAG